MNYFGLTINNESMCVKIPEEKIKELFKKLNDCVEASPTLSV
jgi:hypothetical protein